MPRQKDLKRVVRARMQKTGEAYTAARSHVLKKSAARKQSAPAPSVSAKPNPKDYAALAGMSDGSLEQKTGRTWEQWVKLLDRHGAGEMSHRDIATLVNTEYEVDDWWSQAVTVGYERIKGLRALGQRRDGTYEASKSRTFNVPVTTLFEAWANARVRQRWLTGASVKVRTSTAPKSMRLDWNQSIVAAWFIAKGSSKSSVALSHTKLPDRATANRIKQYWTERLDALGEMLAER
jgi:hypothetical protein